jgi:aryl-alcohol dehydrogenase-like predicted oxidoreductase
MEYRRLGRTNLHVSAVGAVYVFTDGGASVEDRKKQFLKGDAL